MNREEGGGRTRTRWTRREFPAHERNRTNGIFPKQQTRPTHVTTITVAILYPGQRWATTRTSTHYSAWSGLLRAPTMRHAEPATLSPQLTCAITPPRSPTAWPTHTHVWCPPTRAPRGPHARTNADLHRGPDRPSAHPHMRPRCPTHDRGLFGQQSLYQGWNSANAWLSLFGFTEFPRNSTRQFQ